MSIYIYIYIYLNSVAVSITLRNATEQITMSGGGLGNDTYRFAQGHLHWGNPEERFGSEHEIEGARYSELGCTLQILFPACSPLCVVPQCSFHIYSTIKYARALNKTYVHCSSFLSWSLIPLISYPAEAHLVFVNNRYATIDQAALRGDGLAVLGFFIGVSYPLDIDIK